jgi:hypothetical protein
VDYWRPKLIINLHEDDEAFEYVGFYVYHYGKDKRLPEVVLRAVQRSGLKIAPTEDSTWENERIVDGVIVDPDETAEDPSVDYYANQTYGTEVIVGETPQVMWPAKARMRAHAAVLNTLPLLWELVNERKGS